MSDPATGATAPAPTQAVPDQGGAAPTQSAPSWLEGSKPETQAWITEQKFAAVDDLAAAHRGLLKLRGVPERELLRLPEKWEETPETAASVYTRLGRPEKPDEYEVPDIPVGDGDYNLANDFKGWAHEAGLSKRQATALAAKYQETLGKFSAQQREAIETQIAEQDVALRKEWGGEYDANLKAGQRAYQAISQAVGVDGKDLEAMERGIGHAKTMKMMALIGRTIGEHESAPTEGAGGGQFGMTPAAAQSKAIELLGEQMKLQRGTPQYERLGQEILRLNHIATGEEIPDYLRPRR